MVNIILASHGEFAEGILQSAQMIFGEQEQIVAATLMPNEGPDDLKAKLDEAVDSFGEDAEILFMVDLWGGTPFNQTNILYDHLGEKSAIVAGLNLPMLLEALGARMGMETAHELASHIISKEAIGIRVKPEELQPQEEVATETEDGQEQAVGSLEPGTVLGDGKIDYVLTRVDTRLLHGQVAINWNKATNPTRIIVVNDTISKDEMRKTLLQQAAPPGVRTNAIPIRKLVEINDDPRFGATRAMLLFDNPQDVLEAVEQGVDIKEVNLGSMAHATGKRMINKALSVDEEDVKTFKALEEHGVTFDVRILPGDSREDLDSLLRKEDLI
ncbi:PTS system, mannose-specific IIB component [Atopostipes suicloacalis DSM 15692]|uniref:PTS system mannose-specific EIIAB component n=1 Tax=Atopostipes suicloacalis DSM 15692 TaxID=1121025 RepID=A0A1M4YZT1_9LACT|nr:mannose/fructose/sorbose PTS transporter subunit IIA [Atopostipes suicloacalis]SHF11077.1 PTS system, mannose-specific IIB component [Atopostipes suicloacalis DSM 15692]